MQIRRSPSARSRAAASSYEIRISTPYTRREHIDRETRAALQLLALSAEGAVFDGEPVHLYICNSMPAAARHPAAAAQTAFAVAKLRSGKKAYPKQKIWLR